MHEVRKTLCHQDAMLGGTKFLAHHACKAVAAAADAVSISVVVHPAGDHMTCKSM